MNKSTASNYTTASAFTRVPEAHTAISNYYGFTPVKKGDLLPAIYHPGSHILYPGILRDQKDAMDLTPVSLFSFSAVHKPLVIVFRPMLRQGAADDIQFLDAFQKDIQIMGGSLLVVSNQPIRDLKRQLGSQNHLWILSDPHNSLAEQFGLYAPENPASDWISGIDTPIPLPAFYVVLPSGEISYHYIDYNFSTYSGHPDDIYRQGFVRQILTRIYQDTHYLSYVHRHGLKKDMFTQP